MKKAFTSKAEDVLDNFVVYSKISTKSLKNKCNIVVKEEMYFFSACKKARYINMGYSSRRGLQ